MVSDTKSYRFVVRGKVEEEILSKNLPNIKDQMDNIKTVVMCTLATITECDRFGFERKMTQNITKFVYN